jgi:hypothetical protein
MDIQDRLEKLSDCFKHCAIRASSSNKHANSQLKLGIPTAGLLIGLYRDDRRRMNGAFRRGGMWKLGASISIALECALTELSACSSSQAPRDGPWTSPVSGFRVQGSGTLTGDEPPQVVKAATANRSKGVAQQDDHFLTQNCYAFSTSLLRASSKSCMKYPRSSSALCFRRNLLQSTC